MHRYYSEAAAELLNELSVTEKGGQTLRLGDYQTGYEYRRTKRAAPERITVLLDDYGLSYDQIEKALDAIIHNHGQENIAAAKRVEFVLDDMLTNGYQSMDGYIPPNQDYINAKASIAGYVETAEGGSGYLDGINLSLHLESDLALSAVSGCCNTLPPDLRSPCEAEMFFLPTPGMYDGQMNER